MSVAPASVAASSFSVIDLLRLRSSIVQSIRSFFESRNYVEVDTPVLARCPSCDPFIEAFSTEQGCYLCTSPELPMKRLLSLGMERIYQIGHAFRAEELGPYHLPEFSMLEWYKTSARYHDLVHETNELIGFLASYDVSKSERFLTTIPVRYLDELYDELAGWQPSRQWDEERYYKDWVDVIEPFLKTGQTFFLIDFPSQVASLAKLKDGDGLLCERFELFIDGIEIANGYTELTDYNEHVERFSRCSSARARNHRKPYPLDPQFMSAIQSGLPECAGVAVGVERLVAVILGLKNIQDVQPLTYVP